MGVELEIEGLQRFVTYCRGRVFLAVVEQRIDIGKCWMWSEIANRVLSKVCMGVVDGCVY